MTVTNVELIVDGRTRCKLTIQIFTLLPLMIRCHN